MGICASCETDTYHPSGCGHHGNSHYRGARVECCDKKSCLTPPHNENHFQDDCSQIISPDSTVNEYNNNSQQTLPSYNPNYYSPNYYHDNYGNYINYNDH